MTSAKVPQHLELGDVVAFGLGAADLVCIACGAVAAWWLATSFDAPTVVRAALAAPALVIGLTLGLVRIGGQDLRVWVLRLVRFGIRPRLLLVERRRCG